MSAVRNLRLFGRDGYGCFEFPTLPQEFLWQVLYPVFIVSIEADPALGVPYGNDLKFPGVFGKWYLYVVPEGNFCILELV